MSVAIKVEAISKKYIIRHEKESARYETLSESLIQGSKNIAAKIKHPFKTRTGDLQTQEEFWALRDINFEINQGGKVGIIGRNGAGKSTLLKVLSRITEPTTGKIHINGRVASLLEVGTGFHPELTGRENVYLNGAILGMSRKEIKTKFDEIVAFAEVEKFLDTPVKRYSSGMYVRLAFAVAAHLEPEILIVDEVLAVGDAQFQKKCLGKMEEVGNEGRTVIFVSHNMGAVTNLCNTAFLIEGGQVVEKGEVASIVATYCKIQEYQGGELPGGYSVNRDILEKNNKPAIKIENIKVANPENTGQGCATGDPMHIDIFYRSSRKWISPAFFVSIKEMSGLEVLRLSTLPISGYAIENLFESGVIRLVIDCLPLVSGKYYLDVGFARESMEFILKLEHIVTFSVEPKDVYKSGLLLDRSRGLITVDHAWSHAEC